jgi:hypothetical protein
VSRIRLTCDGQRSWEVLAAGDSAQIHGFTLRTGWNPCYQDEVSEPEYRVVFPQGRESFEIKAGAACALEVWGSGSSAASADIPFGGTAATRPRSQ